MFTIPLIIEFRIRFARDFPFAAPGNLTDQEKVLDADIQLGLDEAGRAMNVAFFKDQATYSAYYLELAAHFMTMNLRASAQGIAGKFPWLDTGKGAGGVSVSSAIPQRILDAPAFAGISSTRYGAKYLLFILPFLSGGVQTVCGRTLP